MGVGEWANDLGRNGIGASHSFVLRLTVERRADQRPATWLRLEAAEDGEVMHFSEVSAALETLRTRLASIIAAYDGAR